MFWSIPSKVRHPRHKHSHDIVWPDPAEGTPMAGGRRNTARRPPVQRSRIRGAYEAATLQYHQKTQFLGVATSAGSISTAIGSFFDRLNVLESSRRVLFDSGHGSCTATIKIE